MDLQTFWSLKISVFCGAMDQNLEPKKSREELLLEQVRGHNERALARWQALHELNVIALQRAGRSTHRWTVIAACAAIVAVLVSLAAWMWPMR